MISRRLLRIKALQELYAYYLSGNPSLEKFEKELLFSVEKTYELYHYLIVMILDIADYAESRIDIARSKYFPTEAEANPNNRLINNPVIELLRNDPQLKKYIATKKINWINNPELIKNFYLELINDEKFKNYMNAPEVTFGQHRDLISYLMTEIIMVSESLDQVLEEKSIYWNDDLDFAGLMAQKTISSCKENKRTKVFPKFKNDDDRKFLLELFRKSVIHSEENRELIKRFAKNWDFERIALMDIFIMQMAITEAIEFPSIPTKVTFNEFIEISKYYSTEKSSIFINGILDKAFNTLKVENRIKKTGRGLIGEV
ncbi:MAG: transcription antitermination factor NusB [Bacteroidales bacterium]|nr:transcription antitermination factor NusB [Bacteroidales bacterium]